MEGQTFIEVPDAPPTAQTCAWCDAPATTELEVERARFGKAPNGQRVMKRRAIVAPACARHGRSVELRVKESPD